MVYPYQAGAVMRRFLTHREPLAHPVLVRPETRLIRMRLGFSRRGFLLDELMKPRLDQCFAG